MSRASSGWVEILDELIDKRWLTVDELLDLFVREPSGYHAFTKDLPFPYMRRRPFC